MGQSVSSHRGSLVCACNHSIDACDFDGPTCYSCDSDSAERRENRNYRSYGDFRDGVSGGNTGTEE